MLGVGVSVDELEIVLSVRLMCCLGRDHRIEHNLEHVVDHSGHQVFHVLIGRPQVRIVIHFNQPDAKVFVEQEIEAEKFIDVGTVIGVHFALNAQETVNYKIFDARQEKLLNLEAVLTVVLVKVALQIVIVECVAFLVLGVSLTLHLEALIR